MIHAIQRLQQRAPRLNLSFPVIFYGSSGAVRGHCLNVSESGLLATFDVEPELWDRGDLMMYAGVLELRQPVRVARISEREIGLCFAFQDQAQVQAQREAIRQLLVIAAETPHLVGGPPF